jgi:hypothetical protein
MANQPDFVMDQWQNEGDQSQIQLFTAGYNFDALIAHSRYMFSNASITDASFVRLRNASLTYSLPQRREGSLNCKIYLQGENLLLFTKFNSGDPEQLSGFLPPLRKLTMGFQLTL